MPMPTAVCYRRSHPAACAQSFPYVLKGRVRQVLGSPIMENVVTQAKIRRIVNREWPEPSTESRIPSAPSCSFDPTRPMGPDNMPVMTSRPVLRNKPLFDFTCTHDARFDAASLFYEFVVKRGIPTWVAYLLAFQFVEKYEKDLHLQQVPWESGQYEVVQFKFSDLVMRYVNEFMHGVRANQNTIPEYPKDLINFEYSAVSDLGSRRYNEDRYVALPSLALVDGKKHVDRRTDSLFCVFDGHNGPFSAFYAASHIPESFLDEPQGDDVLDYCVRAYYRTNTRMTERCKHDHINSGTTAACVFIRDNRLYMLWAGDSGIFTLGKGGVSCHSTRHHPSDPAEQQRIVEQGGFVINGRVNNVLNISRAMGETLAENMVIADPDVKVYDVKADDYLLVLTSDGISDTLDEEQFYKALLTGAQTITYEERDQLAHCLVKACNGMSEDNMTAVVVYLKPAQEFFSTFGNRE